MRYLLGNWKSNHTVSQTNFWFTEFSKSDHNYTSNLSIVLCLPFTSLSEANRLITQYHLRVQLGAQDTSLYLEGKHTGDVTASMLAELVTYCLVGHSERRLQLNETSDIVAQKAIQLLEHSITPVVCLDTPYLEEQIKALYQHNVPLDNLIFAYEPLAAVGTGKPQDPEDVELVVSQLSFLTQSQCPILYGGSVNSQNIASYLVKPHLDGCLVGNQSLQVEDFTKLISALHAF